MDFLNAVVAITNLLIIPATTYGAQLALGALGVTLIYSILRFSNFAHGDTMAFGTVVTIGAALGNVMAAGFLLWAFQRVFLSQPEETSLRIKTSATLSTEVLIAAVIIFALLGLGFYTEPWLELIDKSLTPLNNLYSTPTAHEYAMP